MKNYHQKQLNTNQINNNNYNNNYHQNQINNNQINNNNYHNYHQTTNKITITNIQIYKC